MEADKGVISRLDKIEKAVMEIKRNMVNIDVILTKEEKSMLDESIENEKNNRLVSLEEIENARNKI